jgi:hypothetical protein
MRWFLLVTALGLALVQAPRPSAPANIAVRDATATSTVSSGEDAYITWTVDRASTGMVYDISADDGPWVEPIDIQKIPLSPAQAATTLLYGVNRGKLPVGRHTFRVRECVADRSVCAVGAATIIDAVPPVACVMSEWGPWTEFPPYWLVNDAKTEEYRYRYRYRGVLVPAGPGAAPCPPSVETGAETRAYHYQPPPLDPVSVAYVKTDSTTQGTWQGRYGGLGVVFAATPGPLPFVTVTPTLANVWTWATSTTDVRGLQKPGSLTDRVAATWYATNDFYLDIRFTDNVVREVAVYAVDWEVVDRAQTIAVLDTQDHVLSTVTTGAELRNGAYYVWRISGHARIRVTRTAGVNAVVFGLLFGPAPQP